MTRIDMPNAFLDILCRSAVWGSIGYIYSECTKAAPVPTVSILVISTIASRVLSIIVTAKTHTEKEFFQLYSLGFAAINVVTLVALRHFKIMTLPAIFFGLGITTVTYSYMKYTY